MKISIVLAALTGSFETDMNRASKTAQKRMKEIEATAKKVGQAVGVALTAAATASAVAVKAAIDRADDLSKAAQKIGVTTESLSTLSYAAQLADVELTELQGGLNRLTKAQGEAAEGNKDLIALFEALGVSFQNANGTLRSTDDTFRDVAAALDRLPDGATKTKAAIDLLGRSGANLIPLTKGLEEAEQRARDLGLELSTQVGKDAEEFNDRLEDVKLMVTSLATAVAMDLLPDLNRLTGQFQEGAEQGTDFAGAAENIANGIRGIVFVADKGFQAIKGIALALADLAAQSALFLSSSATGRLFVNDEQRQALRDISAVTGAGANEAADSFLGRETPQGVSPFSGSRGGRAAATRDSATEAIRAEEAERDLAESYGAADRAAAAAAAAATANAAATREAAAAAREAERAAKAEAEAAKKVAEEKYEQQRELRELRAEEARQMQEAKDLVDQTLADIAFETKLLGLNNLEREKAIALRYANVDAASAEGQAISKALDDLDHAMQVAEGMDVVRDSTRGLFEDLMSGSKSASDAFKDFVANILDGIAQIVARNLTEQLLGSFGSAGGGAAGGGLASIFGAFFGGARAGGGPVYPGKAFLVGEQGPELFIPPAAGTIASAAQTAAMGRSGLGDVHFHTYGSTSKRARDRQVIDAGRLQRRATAEFA